MCACVYVWDKPWLKQTTVFYSANFAPRFERGMWAMIGTSIALVAWTVAIRWFQRRDAGREMDKQRACEVAEE